MNEDETRVQRHKLERNDELRMEKSAKEMLHVQRKLPQTLNNDMDKHPNLFLYGYNEIPNLSYQGKTSKQHFRSTTTILSYQKLSGYAYQN